MSQIEHHASPAAASPGTWSGGALGLPMMVAAFVLVPWVGPLSLLLVVPATMLNVRLSRVLGHRPLPDVRAQPGRSLSRTLRGFTGCVWAT